MWVSRESPAGAGTVSSSCPPCATPKTRFLLHIARVPWTPGWCKKMGVCSSFFGCCFSSSALLVRFFISRTLQRLSFSPLFHGCITTGFGNKGALGAGGMYAVATAGATAGVAKAVATAGVAKAVATGAELAPARANFWARDRCLPANKHHQRPRPMAIHG
jgi:hypothetical protein